MEEDANLENISHGLYKIISENIGSVETIKMRRLVLEIRDKIHEIDRGQCPHDHLQSGSKAEGFDFPTSDHDQMVVYNCFTVEMDNAIIHPKVNSIVVRMETDQTRPGFCLIRVVSLPHWIDLDITDYCVRYQNCLYLSSVLWRDGTKCYIPEAKMHGPCENGMLEGVEYDIVHCLKCPKWPKETYPSIRNLARSKWPSLHVLSRIVNNGCHLVPIGDKSSEKEHLEWRLSFSEAEKTLIQEMNHCQFLCYGLLKIFLKEAINTRPDVDGLLCSYFLKTTIFWEMFYSGTEWFEHDFLKWFWNCFRRLISWVTHGYCPNFFIPENNMFLGKIYGRSQQVLLRHMTSLYRLGYKSLLACRSLSFEYLTVLNQPNVVEFPHIDEISRKVLMDKNLLLEMNNTYHADIYSMLRIKSFLQYIHSQNENYSELVIITNYLQFVTQNIIFCFALHLPPPSFASSNRAMYKSVFKSINTLRRNKRDVSSHSILSAIVLYKHGMYHHSIRKVKIVKDRIQGPHVMRSWELSLPEYRKLGGEYKPLDVMMRKFLVCGLSFLDGLCLPELYLEHKASKWHLRYSPMVTLNFLLFLSYYHLSRYGEANSVLHELSLLINNDEGYHIHRDDRALSWEILGICQQISGYIDEAYLSYQNALREPLFNYFREVTLSRIKDLGAILNKY